MRSVYALAAASLLCVSMTARADSFVYYSGTVTGDQEMVTFDPTLGYPLYQVVSYTHPATGTLEIRDTSIRFVALSLPLYYRTLTSAFNQFPLGYQNGCYGYDSCFEAMTLDGVSLETITFYGNDTSYVSDPFGSQIAVTDYFSGIFTEIGNSSAVTPEPSSFALLGTGLLGVAGVLRKRVA